MESGKWKTENEKSARTPEKLSTVHYSLSIEQVCAACGTVGRRENANFCLTCGKLLREDYQPLDNLRSSYRSQGKSFITENSPAPEVTYLFEQNRNSVSETAWACLVYSFVPYLGILFVPLAFFVGGFGVIVSYNKPNLGGRKLAFVSVVLSLVVLAVQVFLWWLLYIIPKLGR